MCIAEAFQRGEAGEQFPLARNPSGIGAERATAWGQGFAEHTAEANEHVLVVPIIETVTAGRNIESLCKVKGVDLFFFGPADYSSTAGYRGQWEGPGVAAQLLAIKDEIRAQGKHCGVVAASPERLSAAANAIETLPLFQPAAFGEGVGDAKVTVGGVLSIWTGKVLGASALPALSRAKYVSVVVPSAVIGTEATLPLTRPASGWAPLSENWISLTPDPPRLSVALSATVTFVLFQPLAFGLGEGTAVVVGGVMVSMSRNTTPAPPRSPPEDVVP